MLGNKHARLIFVAYAIIVHLLIFVVGFLQSSRLLGCMDSCRTASELTSPFFGVLLVLDSQVLYKYSHVGVSRYNLAETCHQFFAAHHLSQETAVDHAHGIHFDSQQLHDSQE